MSADISKWLLEDIDESQLESESPIAPLAEDDVYNEYSVYYAGYNVSYSDYYNYYNYSDYYNYYNYSDSISVTSHPVSQSALVNEVVTFSVSTSNTINSCQWYVAESPTGAGTAIPGATTPTLTITVSEELDGNYYYCIVKRSSNSATSNRALLTVMSVNAFDIYTNVGYTTDMFFVRANPPTTEIISATVADESIASVDSEGVITGISVGKTTCTVTGSNGATATFNITVLSEESPERVVAILSNIAIAIREYRKISYSIYPNQMANILRGNSGSVAYEQFHEVFQDIASAIREIDGSTDTMYVSDFYRRILSLV